VGPRHHLTSGLQDYVQEYDKTEHYLQYVSTYGRQGALPGMLRDSVGFIFFVGDIFMGDKGRVG
jgi:hypothetical protein